VSLGLTLEGLSRAWHARRLVALVWLIQAAAAAAVAFPFWRVLSDVLAPLPEADTLGSRLDFAAVADLAEMRPALIGVLGPTLLLVALVGVVLGAALAGGVLEVLSSSDERSLGHRFGRGAGRFFGRLLRASLLVGVGTAIAGALAVLPFVLLTRLHFRAGWDTGVLGPLGAAATLALVALLASLVLDATRIVVVRSDGPVLRSLTIGTRLVLGHPVAWCGVWLLNGALLAVAFALYSVFRGTLPGPAGWLLPVVVAGQQAFVVARTTLRVALLASEGRLVDRLRAGEGGPRVAQPPPSSPVLPA
jgi:hypothetical protein